MAYGPAQLLPMTTH